MPECQLVERHIDGGLAVLEGAKTALPDSSEDLLRDLFSARVRVLSHNVAAQDRQTMVPVEKSSDIHCHYWVYNAYSFVQQGHSTLPWSFLPKWSRIRCSTKMVLEPMLEHAGGEVELFARLGFQSFVCLALSARQTNPISTIILGRMKKSEGANDQGMSGDIGLLHRKKLTQSIWP